jgi:hypothetical protein
MSQIKGGRADKAGNAFERLWVVSLALDVVEGTATALKWEALGPEGHGIELEVRRPDGTREKHQCKIGNRNEAKWTATRLAPVLEVARFQLESDPSIRFVFVSPDPVRVIAGLAARARSCDDDGRDFLDYCLTSKHDRVEYQSLCASWGLNSTDESDARIVMALLRRMDFEGGIWDPSERRRLYRHAEAIVDGKGEEVVTFLGRFLEENLGNSYRSDDLREVLREHGFSTLDLGHNTRVPEGIERLQRRFRSALKPHLIAAEVLSRPEPSQLVERMRADGGARLIFVTGQAGSGKSGVLLEATRLLDEQSVPYLPIRLDMHYSERTVRAYSQERLELPASPGVCLRTLADGRRAVLLIDQLDAVRWTLANSEVRWELCKEIIDEALRFPNVSVVVAGRTVDLDDDPRINHWKKEKEVGQAIEVERFHVARMPEDVVASVVDRYGASYASLQSREKELLSNAQSLQLWWRLAEDGKVGTFSTRALLLGSFWEHYRDKAVREFPDVTLDTLNALLDKLVEFMDTRGRLDAPNALLDRHRAAAKALRGLAILDRTNGTTQFAHQSHLDYLTIERVFQRALRDEVTPIEWLRSHDQSLFRRDQVRFLLQLLRDQDPELYVEFLKDIFVGEGIRFHIQHLALTTLAQADPPTHGEHDFIKRLWSEEPWHLHILERVLAGHAPWLDRFTDDGTIPAMLASENETQRDEALFLCDRSAEAAPEWFERVLAPHWNPDDSEWAQLIGSRLAHDADHDTPTVFEWRRARARAGANTPEIYNAERLASNDQTRAISYLVAIADGLTSNVERAAAGDERRQVEVNSERFTNLLNACDAHPRLAWDSLLSVHARAVELEAALREESLGAVHYVVHESAHQIISLLHDFLIASGASLLQSEGATFLAELTKLGKAPATAHARRLAVELLAKVPSHLSDDAVVCFFSVDSPLDIEVLPDSMTRTDLLYPQEAAINTIRALGEQCSLDAARRIERVLLTFHAAYERESVKWQLRLIRDGRWTAEHPNHYGLPQYALLLALPIDRLSDEGARVLSTWRGKFHELSRYRDTDPIGMLPVASPIPSGKARYVSDNVWVQIVHGEGSGRRSKWSGAKDGKYVEASPRYFASSLEEAGKLDPGRYVRLGLRFPAHTAEAYWSALLHVATLAVPPQDADASWAAARVEDVETLFAHIGAKSNTEIAKEICRVVGERSGEAWSNSTLALLREYALHNPHPDVDPWSDSVKSRRDSQSLEAAVLNSARCTSIRAASSLLWANPRLLDWAKDLAMQVVQDPHPALRAASFDLAFAIGKHDLGLALDLMVRAYEGTYDAILSIQRGPDLIRYLWRSESALTPVFERALASADAKTVELAAYWTTVGSTLENRYTELAGLSPRGSTAARVGVVRAFVDITHHHDEHRATCLERLLSFLEDEDEKVLDAVDRTFRRVGFLDADEAPRFAERFAFSAAFRRRPSSLLHQLSEFEGSLVPYAGTIEAIVAQLSGPLAMETQSVAHRHGMAGRDIATVLLRLYQQCEHDADLKSRCLDHWDTLLRTRVGSGQDVLRRIDS